MARIVARRILPERVFGRRATTRASRKHATGADLARARSATSSPRSSPRVALGARLQHDEPERHLPAQLVGDADHGALGDVGVRRDDLLHRAGREAVAGDVDDVVDAPHHEQVAVLVDVAAVAGQVVAREAREVGRRRSARRRSRASAACRAAAAAGWRSRPARRPATSSPVVVQDADVVAGHGLRRRARPSRAAARCRGSSRRSASRSRSATSGRSPAAAEQAARPSGRCRGRGARRPGRASRSDEVVRPPRSAASGSSLLIARNAVGAVNSAVTPCCAITRQNAPASGVPTGLPS